MPIWGWCWMSVGRWGWVPIGWGWMAGKARGQWDESKDGGKDLGQRISLSQVYSLTLLDIKMTLLID